MSPQPDRRKRFKAALALLDESQTAFATAQGVTPHHLMRVLRGDRESPRLEQAIDAKIAEAADFLRAPDDETVPEPNAAAA